MVKKKHSTSNDLKKNNILKKSMSKRMKSNNKMEVDSNQSMTKEEVEMDELKKKLNEVWNDIRKKDELINKVTDAILNEKDKEQQGYLREDKKVLIEQQKMLIEQQKVLEIRELELKIEKAKLDNDEKGLKGLKEERDRLKRQQEKLEGERRRLEQKLRGGSEDNSSKIWDKLTVPSFDLNILNKICVASLKRWPLRGQFAFCFELCCYGSFV